MAIAEELQIIVDAKVSQAVKDMKKVDKSLDDTSRTTNKLKDAFKAMAGPVAIGAVIAGMIKIGKESEKAFQVQEKAVAGVNAALKVTGQFTDEASQDMQNYASELQKVTTVGDETTLSLIQTALNMGLTAEQSKEAAKQAIGMSEAFGVGLETSLRGSANAMLGNYDALTRYLPAIKTATTEAEKAAIVQKQLGDAFAIAEANALTADGVQKQLENSYGDLQETIGGVISLALTPYREELRKEVESVNQSISAHLLRKKALEGNATLIEELTLKQIEQQKAEDELAQALLNVDAAENQVLDTKYLSLVQIEQIEKAKEAALVKAENTITALEDEITLRKIGTAEAQKALDAENELTAANIRLAQGVILVNDATSETNDLLGEEAGLINKELENMLALATAREEAATNYIEIIQFTEDERNAIEKTASDARIALAQQELDAKVDMAFQYANSAMGLLSALDSLSSATTDAEIQRMSEEQQAAYDSAVARGDSEKQLTDLKERQAEQLDAKKKQIARDEAKRKKALGLLNVGIDTASAIIGMLANPGGIAGIVLSALAGTTGAIQAAAIASTPLPALAEGGSFLTSGAQNIQVGDNAGGIERVTVEPVSSAGANESVNGGGGGNYFLMIDGEQFNAFLQKKINNRNIVSSQGGAI